MILTPEEARFLVECVRRTEVQGEADVRSIAAVSRRLRWVLAGSVGSDPGGAEDLRGFCASVVAEIFSGQASIAGAFAEAIVGIEAKLAEKEPVKPESAPEEREEPAASEAA